MDLNKKLCGLPNQEVKFSYCGYFCELGLIVVQEKDNVFKECWFMQQLVEKWYQN